MAATVISKTAVPRNMSGYNLTDSGDFTAMTAGAGNGVKFRYDPKDMLVLKNDTISVAVYTFKVRVPAGFSTYGVSVTDPTISVAVGKTYLIRLSDIFKDGAGDVTVECDQAAKIMVLDL